MPYEIFGKRITRNNPASITIGTTGRLGLSKAAAELLSREAFDHVLLMWDADRKRVAIRPIRKKDSRAYRVNFSASKAGAGIAAKAFCDYIGYDYSAGSRRYPATWNETESAIEIDLTHSQKNRELNQKLELHSRHSRSA